MTSEHELNDAGGSKGVLIAQKFSSPGGSQMSLVHHLELLDKDAYRARVVVAREGWLTERLTAMGVPWTVMPFGHWTNPAALPRNIVLIARLARYIRKHDIKLVHANEHWVAPQCLMAARMTGIPAICHFRTGLGDLTPARVRKYLFSRFDRVFVVADVLKKTLVPLVKHPERVIVVRDGVTTSGAPGKGRKRGSKKIAICVGRIYPVKGQAKILNGALAWLKESPRHFLLFVGDTKTDDNYVAGMRDTVKAHGLQRQALFLGVRHDVERLLAAADVLLAYSTVEGVPRVVMEAMLAGKPVIVSNTPGMTEVVEDNVTGRVLDFEAPGNPLLDALREMEDDAAEWAAMGERGMAEAEGKYSTAAMSRRISLVYDELTKRDYRK